jgi:hypothetical protein
VCTRIRRAGRPACPLWAARFLAWTYQDLGEIARTRAQHKDDLRQARALDNKSVEAATLGALGEYDLDEGRIRDGISMVKEACAIHRELGDHFNVATGLCRLARALLAEGRPEKPSGSSPARRPSMKISVPARCHGLPSTTSATFVRRRSAPVSPRPSVVCRCNAILELTEAGDLIDVVQVASPVRKEVQYLLPGGSP